MYLLLQQYSTEITRQGVMLHPIQKIDKTKQTKTPSSTITMELYHCMDTTARQQRQIIDMPPNTALPIDGIHLMDMYGKINSKEKQTIETNWNTYNIEQYYIRRWKTTMNILSTLDWTTYNTTYLKLLPPQQTYVIKLMTGWLPVFHNLNKMTPTPRLCPLCQNNKTIPHIYQCKSREKWRQHFNHQLQQHLQHNKTPKDLHEIITQHIHKIFTTNTTTSNFFQYTIFAGLLPNIWKNYIYDDNLTPDKNIQNQTRWANKTSQWFVQRGHELWIARTKEIHSNDDENTTMDYILDPPLWAGSLPDQRPQAARLQLGARSRPRHV